MTQHEKDALITYIDGQLMVLCQALKTRLDPDAVGTLYDAAYGLIYDLHETIIVSESTTHPATKKSRR